MPLPIDLDYDRGVPVYRQISEAVLAALATGQLAPDEQLPTIHDLAGQLGVNPNTVARSYRDLERDGHIVSRRGRGTFAAIEPPSPPPVHEREEVLRQIFERAVVEGARHGLTPRDIFADFRRRLKK